MKKFVTAALFEVGALSLSLEGYYDQPHCCTLFSHEGRGDPSTTFCLEKDSTDELVSSTAHMLEPGYELPVESYFCGHEVVAEFCVISYSTRGRYTNGNHM